MKSSCVNCGQRYELPDELIGRRVECECGYKWRVLEHILPSCDVLADLNDEQAEAVMATEGYVRVVAGAGTGKTRVLTRRLAYLIQERNIPPDRILSVTFTNKAAGEMKNRVRQLLGDSANSRVQTFHGFCNTVLREDIHHLCYPPSFSIMDEEDQKLLFKEIFTEFGLTSRDLKYKEVKKIIAKEKATTEYVPFVTSPDAELLNKINSELKNEKTETRIVGSYLQKQRKTFFLDYDDLIMFALYLFESNPAVLEKWQERLLYIQVDEFQDANRPQYELVNLLAAKNKNLFVVGDPDQTIYEWRGADVRLFLDFPADRTILLRKNYRSVPEILSVGNSLILHNRLRIANELHPVKPGGEKPRWHQSEKWGGEGEWVAAEIVKLSKRRPFSDIAILCRSLYMTREIEEALIKRSIPYYIFNGTDFYRRREIKDALSFLRLIAGEDDLSFLRIINVPPRGMGKKRIEALKLIAESRRLSLFRALEESLSDRMFARASEFVEIIRKMQKRNQSGDTVSDILNDVLRETQYEASILLEGDDDRKKNLEELKRSIYNMEFEAQEKVPLLEYLNQISLYSEKNEDPGRDSVKLMTIHAAKGLEFPCVFVVGLNEGSLPSSHALRPEEVEQERRVAYVAFTRAEEILFLSSGAITYGWDGSLRETSRFIGEIKNVIEQSIASSINHYLLPGDSDRLRKALEIILIEREAGVGFLQRRLGIGYNAASELIDQLEERGIVGPPIAGGSKREILIFE